MSIGAANIIPFPFDGDRIDTGIEEAFAYHANASKNAIPPPDGFDQSTAAQQPGLDAGQPNLSGSSTRRWISLTIFLGRRSGTWLRSGKVQANLKSGLGILMQPIALASTPSSTITSMPALISTSALTPLREPS